MSSRKIVLVLGGGEFASAIAYFLRLADISVGMIFCDTENHLRRPICFHEAIHCRTKNIHDISAVLVTEEHLDLATGKTLEQKWQNAIEYLMKNREIPVFRENEYPEFIQKLKPDIIIKTEKQGFSELPIDSAGMIIGLHPRHRLHDECHLVIESRLNYFTGESYTSAPIENPDFDKSLFRQPFEEVLSPLSGVFTTKRNIGEEVQRNEAIGKINQIEIRSPYQGQFWGLSHSGRMVNSKQPLALIYQGPVSTAYHFFDFRHRAVAGTALREVLHFCP